MRLLYRHSLMTSLLLLSDAVYGAHTTKCRVKRKVTVFSANNPLPTSPLSASSVPGTQTTQSITPEPTQLPPFDYANQKLRGVNLGGWFMMEPWITPSIFEETGNDAIVDEYTFGQYQDRAVALERLERHWSSWYTEQDFIEIKEAGLNHIRLPISYWSVPIEQDIGPYIPGAWPHILRALSWARKHEIRVVLDLHGAPGSQNGYDNSGQRTDPRWATDPAFVDQTLRVLEFLAREVGDQVEVIELLNEVAGFRQEVPDVVRKFWKDGYDRVRAAAGDRVRVMIGDAFMGLGNWNGYMGTSEAHGVLMDLHVYQIFSHDQLARSWDEHILHMCSRIPEFTDYAHNNLWLVIGEWSNAVTDCTKYLNGRGVGARWDGTWFSGDALGSCEGFTGSYRTFSEEYKAFLRRYFEAQIEAAERVTGWIYWTWKAENSDDWSYQKGIEAGFIPRNPDDRLYPDICG